MISVDKIKENIKCPQFGDLYYGKWGAQKLEIREALKFMCDLYDSMDSIIKLQQERIDKAIEYIETLEKREAYKIENNENGVPELKVDNEEYLVLCKYNKLLNILKGEDK